VLRQALWRAVATVLIAGTALVSVGVTAPADSPFTISIRPVLSTLAVDVDVKLGVAHFHKRWSALPDGSKI